MGSRKKLVQVGLYYKYAWCGAFNWKWVSPWLTVDQCGSRVTTYRERDNNNVNLMFMAFLFLLKRMFDMEKDNTFSITFSITALSVYAISCVFFIFLVASLSTFLMIFIILCLLSSPYKWCYIHFHFLNLFISETFTFL